MPSSHFIRAAAAASALGVARLASAQIVVPPAPLEAGATTLTIFLRGTPIGTEQVGVSRTADGWTISSSGRLAPPVDATARRLEIHYTPEWRARDMLLDGAVRGVAHSFRTTIDGTTAKSDIDTAGQRTQKADTIDPNAVLILPNTFFAPFEAIAARLKTTAAGTEIPAYAAPSASLAIRVGESFNEQIQTTSRMIAARRTKIALVLPGQTIDADLWTDEAGRMIRLSMPAQLLEIVREDIASVSSRSVPISRSNDEAVKIPGNGFVLAATVSKPPQAAGGKLPAVALAGGSGPADRDGLAFGIPILGQIAGALADAGFIVVRYDKRGIGQSGGRAESAGLGDYAEDLRAVVKYLSGRKDVDPKRIAIIGHSEGGAIALIAASKEKRIAAVGLLATAGTSGADLVLAQQQHVLEKSKLSPEEKQARIDLQKRIHQAVLTGKGLDQLPADVRKAADNAEFQSMLGTDPAKIMPDVRQPILIVQGNLDTQVPPAHADRLESLARQRKKQPAVEVVKVPDANHLLVPATTGEVEEYGTLPDRHVSSAVLQALVAWLKKTL